MQHGPVKSKLIRHIQRGFYHTDQSECCLKVCLKSQWHSVHSVVLTIDYEEFKHQDLRQMSQWFSEMADALEQAENGVN